MSKLIVNSQGKAYSVNGLALVLPSEPVFYSGLVFDGTAYIKTDIIPPANSSFVVPLGNETLKSGQRLFLAPTSVGQIGAIVSPGNSTATNRFFSIYYGTSQTVSTNRSLAWSTSTYNFFLTPQRFGWDSTSFTFTKGSNNATGGLVIGQNSSGSGQPYTGTVRNYFKIFGSDAQNVTTFSGFESYTPLYTLRPCLFEGEAGLWCVESRKFYGNSAGSGALSVI